MTETLPTSHLPISEHTSRDPWPDDVPVPTGAARLVKALEKAGWASWVTYARGYVLGIDGPPGDRKKQAVRIHSVALRFRSPTARRGYVSWEKKADKLDASWVVRSAWTWAPDVAPVRISIDDLKGLMTGNDPKPQTDDPQLVALTEVDHA